MSTSSLFPVFEPEIPERREFPGGQATYLSLGRLDRLAEGLQVRPLSTFLGRSPEEGLDLSGETDGLGTEELLLDSDPWFEPDEALSTIAAILKEVTEGSMALPMATVISEELSELEALLQEAARRGCRFRLELQS